MTERCEDWKINVTPIPVGPLALMIRAMADKAALRDDQAVLAACDDIYTFVNIMDYVAHKVDLCGMIKRKFSEQPEDIDEIVDAVYHIYGQLQQVDGCDKPY